MDSTIFVVLGVLALLVVVVLLVGRPGGRPGPPRSVSGMAEREHAMAAQADIEEHDIEEMIEARNALRKRIGRPPIGDELAEDARGESPDRP